MNKEMEKKEYVAPAMTIVELSVENQLLACSGEGGFGCSDDDDFE